MATDVISTIVQILGILFLLIGIAFAMKQLLAKEKAQTAEDTVQMIQSKGNAIGTLNVEQLKEDEEDKAKSKSTLELIVELVNAIAKLPESVFFTLVGLILLFGSDYIANLLLGSA